MTVMQGPAEPLAPYKDVDDEIARKINERDPEAFLRAARERYEKDPGEYDQDDAIVVPWDTFADLVQLAEIAYSWAKASNGNSTGASE